MFPYHTVLLLPRTHAYCQQTLLASRYHFPLQYFTPFRIFHVTDICILYIRWLFRRSILRINLSHFLHGYPTKFVMSPHVRRCAFTLDVIISRILNGKDLLVHFVLEISKGGGGKGDIVGDTSYES